MKKLKKLLLAATISIGVLALPNGADAATYTVKSGDSMWKISNNMGVSLLTLQKLNPSARNYIYPGQRLTIPESITNSEKQLMAKLVHAEAKGESYAGKVAVATVILNRVDHSDFPNSVSGVVYQKSNGYYAFTPVQSGTINQTPDTESVRAVNEALAFRGQGSGSIYFYNPKTAKSDWILSRQVTVTIGNHRFAK
ncbi:cell wall hydrolase [Aquibacillus kalidii]|uniref:cell wall hydrolase n=1 Tax=Aquibacillus kalidii TaxID=2762597 RepID=UPI001644CEEA